MHKVTLTTLVAILIITLKANETDQLLNDAHKVNSSGSLNNLYGASSDNQSPSPVSQHSSNSDDSNNTNWATVNWSDEPAISRQPSRCKKSLGPLLILAGVASTTVGMLSCFGQLSIDDDGTSCGIVPNVLLNGAGLSSMFIGLLCTKKYLCSSQDDNPA